MLDKIIRATNLRNGISSEDTRGRPLPIGGLDKALVFGLSLLLFMIFSRSFFTEFGFHNDYSAFQWPFNEAMDLWQIGRPLGALLLNVQFYFFHDVPDFTWGRIFSSVVTVAGFLLTGSLFARMAPSMARLAFPAAFLIWTLPPALLYVLWLTNFVPGILATIIASLSYLIVDNSYRARSRRQAISVRLCGYALLFLCYLIYPANAYFFLVFTSWRALFAVSDRTAWHVVEELIAVAVLSATYSITIAFGLAPLLTLIFGSGTEPISAGAYQMSPILGLSHQICYAASFLSEALPLWLNPFGWETLYVIVSVIMIGSACRIFQNRKYSREILLEVFRWASVLSCLTVSMLPFVLSHFGLPPPIRVVFSAQGIVVIALLGATGAIFRSWPRIEYVAVGLLAVIATFLAVSTVAAVTINASSEFNFLKNSLDKKSKTAGPTLILLPPVMDVISEGWLGRFVYSDFRMTATNAYPILGMPQMILRDKGLSADERPFIYVPWASNVIIEGDKQADAPPLEFPVIDMSLAGFQYASREKAIHQDNSIIISVSKADALGSAEFSVAFAFDTYGPNFWETNSSLPIDLTVRSHKPCLDVSGYEFRADSWYPERMPRSWQILTNSPEDQQFKVIDQVTEAPAWRVDEVRRFSLPHRACISALKFRFLSLDSGSILRIDKINLLPN